MLQIDPGKFVSEGRGEMKQYYNVSEVLKFHSDLKTSLTLGMSKPQPSEKIKVNLYLNTYNPKLFLKGANAIQLSQFELRET